MVALCIGIFAAGTELVTIQSDAVQLSDIVVDGLTLVK